MGPSNLPFEQAPPGDPNADAAHTLRNPAKERLSLDFPGGTVVKNLPANAGEMGSSAGPGRSHMPRSN